MPRLILSILLLTLAWPLPAVVLISEYIEGSSLNKGIELFNSDAAAFDLAGAGCELRGYQNGSSSVGWTVPLTGSIPATGVYVIAHTSASFAGDQTGDLQFNGDDAVAIACNGSLVDVIGQIGFDPGSAWGSGSTSTANNTLRRKTSVCTPDDNGGDTFDPAVEWDGFGLDEFTGLGTHTATCGPDVTPPTIVAVTPSTTGPTPATTLSFTVLFSEAVSDFDDLSDVTVNHSGTSNSGISFTANNSSSYSVIVDNISGTGTLSLTVNSGAVVDGAGNPNSDTLTSDGVIIDPDLSPPGDYYANVDPSSATSLRATLHDTIDDHQWFPYTDSSTDTWDILELADEDPNDSGRILAVYENETYAKVGGGNSNYNREHTWPRSYGLGQTGTQFNTAATDAHNLRLSNIDYNSDRGNKPFASCDPGINAQCSERVTVFNDGVGGMGGPYPGDSNWTTLSTDGNQGSWEVWNDRRGDIARTMFYMAIRYEGGTHGVTGFQEPDLELTNDRNLIQTASGGTVYMGLLDTLLEWHEQDPVDDRERDRNESVFVFQTNRNPFVDHPEWVDCLWNDICAAADQIFSDAFASP